MLQAILKSRLEKDEMFADIPIYLTHTYLLSDDDNKDFNPCGVRPFRLLMLNFAHCDIKVGIIVGDIQTRVDLLYKSLENSNLIKVVSQSKLSD